MATYATQADAEAYIEGLVVDDADGFARLLERAERDVDSVLGPLWPNDDTGLKLDPTVLRDWEARALANAVCAQVEFLLVHGKDPLARPAAVAKEEGPDFKVTYAQATSAAAAGTGLLSPRMGMELAPIRHLRNLSGRARA